MRLVCSPSVSREIVCSADVILLVRYLQGMLHHTFQEQVEEEMLPMAQSRHGGLSHVYYCTAVDPLFS